MSNLSAAPPDLVADHSASRLILVRHCQASGQSPDAELTSEGLEQAERLAVFLARQPVDLVVSSEYLRARQTAEPLAERHGLTVQVDGRANERILSEQPIADWREVLRSSFADPDLRGPGGESAREALERAWNLLDMVRSVGPNLPVIVTHGNLLSLVLHSLDGSFGFEGWETLTNPDVYLMEQSRQGSRAFRRMWR